MIDTKALRQKILDMAIKGELVPQDPTDEPASILLEKIRAEKQQLIKEGKIKKDKADSVIFKGDDNRHYENLPNGWVEISLFEICWLEDGNQINGEELVYWDAKALRGKNTKVKISYGKIVEQGKNVILVDGENSGEVFTIPYRGYLGSTFKILQIAPLVSQNFVKIILDYNRDLFRENKTGSAIPHLNKRLFKTMNVLLPPFLEQERIAKNVDLLLSQIDIIEQNQTDIETLYDELKKRTLDLAIRGKLVPQDENDEPASELLKRIRAEKKAQLCKKYVDSYIYKGDDNYYYEKVGSEAKNISEEIPFDIPENWEWIRLGTLFQHNTGKALNSSNTKGNKRKYITTSNLYWDHFKHDNLREMLFTDEETEKCSVRKGDLLVCEGGDIGRAAIWNYDYSMCIQNHIHKLRPYQSINIYFYYYVFYVYKNIGLIGGKGIGIQGLSSNALDRLIIPLPPIQEQNRIIDEIDMLINKLKDEN